MKWNILEYKNSMSTVAFALLIVGCGGGGGGGGSASSSSSLVTVLSGIAVDPYIQGATFYHDSNDNGVYDSSETLSSASDSNGKFTFSSAIPVNSIVRMKDKGTHNGVAFTGDISAKLTSSGVVSPLTTLSQKGFSNALATYAIVDTNQNSCYDSSSGVSATCTGIGYDADYTKNQPNYTINGTVITDNITQLMWTQSSDVDGDGVTTDSGDKLLQSEAVSYCSNLTLAEYEDWRLPDIKTLYSLILFSGEDPSGYEGSDTSALTTFLYTGFTQAFGDTSNNERIIDGQYATTTKQP